jgi:hypothetical protein
MIFFCFVGCHNVLFIIVLVAVGLRNILCNGSLSVLSIMMFRICILLFCLFYRKFYVGLHVTEFLYCVYISEFLVLYSNFNQVTNKHTKNKLRGL